MARRRRPRPLVAGRRADLGLGRGTGETITLTAEYVAARGEVDFATALLLTLDAQARQVLACSAGHLMPVRVPPEGTAAIVDLRQGPPLGIVGHRYVATGFERAGEQRAQHAGRRRGARAERCRSGALGAEAE